MTPKENGKTTEPTTGMAIVPQEHGGALNAGGTPGNKGGDGRPPSKVREACRQSFAERVPILEKIADGKLPDVKPADRAKAMDMLGKYGGVDKIALTLDEQPERELTPERVKDLWAQLEMIKDIKQFERMLVAAAAKQTESGALPTTQEDGP